MTTLLPKLSCPVYPLGGMKSSPKGRGHVLLTVISQTLPGTLSQVSDGLLQPLRIKFHIRGDHMQMRWHENKGVDSQPLFAKTEIETVGHDETRLLADERREANR